MIVRNLNARTSGMIVIRRIVGLVEADGVGASIRGGNRGLIEGERGWKIVGRDMSLLTCEFY